MSGHVLELENVTKRFGDFTAVDDVSLSIPRGSIYGFLGPNGAGKTTTIRMIFDIIKPTSGYISILGASSALAVRRRIGYLPEEKGLYKAMTAAATIAYFRLTEGALTQDCKAARLLTTRALRPRRIRRYQDPGAFEGHGSEGAGDLRHCARA